MSTRENICLIAIVPFRENFIFANSAKRHIFDVKIRDYDMIYFRY